jgi:hypothetical protein
MRDCPIRRDTEIKFIVCPKPNELQDRVNDNVYQFL